MATIAGLIDMICADTEALATIRRDIHAHPELGFCEQRTSDVIATALTQWGIPVHRGIGKTGIVGVIKGGQRNRAIGLRADIDALPMTEENTFAHASIYAGRMHACGHDGHTAILLAAAKYLASHRNFDGTVYLIFQPAEESGGGAHAMIEDGLFRQFPMEAIFGLHNWPGLPLGHFAINSGAIFASSSEFRITICGKGAHAAIPQNSVDPVPIACQIVQAFQTVISRNKSPNDPAVISVTTVQAGEAVNVIPQRCELRGTVRAFSSDVVDMIERRMREIVDGTCQAYCAASNFEFRRMYPPTVNHSQATVFTRQVLVDFAGSSNVASFEPTMSAEDFSYYLLEKPGCYFLIGNGSGGNLTAGESEGANPCTLHNPRYDFNDELIPIGGSLWVRLVESWFRDWAPVRR